MSLARSLAMNLLESLDPNEWIAAREVVIGSHGRLDVLAVRRRQFKRKQLRGYEIKTSRSDFLADVGSQKWRKYLSVCHQVYFATPKGMIKKSELPAGAGLMVFSEDKGWSVVVPAKVHEPDKLDVDSMLAIMFSIQREHEKQVSDLTRRSRIKRLSDLRLSVGGEVARRLAGAAPEVEKNVDMILREISGAFGSTFDALKAIRFAASLVRNRKTVESAANFLSELSSGLMSADGSAMALEKALKEENRP